MKHSFTVKGRKTLPRKGDVIRLCEPKDCENYWSIKLFRKSTPILLNKRGAIFCTDNEKLIIDFFPTAAFLVSIMIEAENKPFEANDNGIICAFKFI